MCFSDLFLPTDIIQTCWKKCESFHINIKNLSYYFNYFNLFFVILANVLTKSFIHSFNNYSLSIYYAMSYVFAQ